MTSLGVPEYGPGFWIPSFSPAEIEDRGGTPYKPPIHDVLVGCGEIMCPESMDLRAIYIAMVKSRVFWGMGDLPPLIGNPFNGYINPYYKVDDHAYHRKTMGV